MQTLKINADRFDEVQWPSHCPSCDKSVAQDSPTKSSIDIKKGLKASFIETPKQFSLALCENCNERLQNYTTLERVGWGLIALAFIGPIFISSAYKTAPSPQILLGAGGSFWLGWLVMMVGGSKKKGIAGVKSLRESRDTWTFSFRNAEFAKQFAELNGPRIKA